MPAEMDFPTPGGNQSWQARWATRVRAVGAYVCQVTGRDTIPRRNRAQPRGAERYTEAHKDEGV